MRPPCVAPQRLHSGIVDHLNAMTEGSGEIEAHPPGPKIVGFADRSSVNNRAWMTNRGGRILPPSCHLTIFFAVIFGPESRLWLPYFDGGCQLDVQAG